jgi:hypothetical protein
VTILVIFVLLAAGAYAQPRSASLGGAVIDRQGRPVPGLTVSVVSMQSGRSAPRVTDQAGQFLFANIPAGQSYYLEIYWGRQLMYRTRVLLARDTNLGVIRL